MAFKRIIVVIIAAAVLSGISIPAAADNGYAHAGTTISASDKDGHRESETELGNLFADAVKVTCGADMAFIPCGNLTGRNIAAGPVDEETAALCIADNEDIVLAETDAEHIYDLLHAGVSHFVLGEDEKIDWEASAFDGYLYTSGLNITFDYSALPDDPVYELKTAEGQIIARGDKKTYYVAMTRSVAEGGYGFPKTDGYTVKGTILSHFMEYVSGKETIESPALNRIKIIGTKDYTIAARFPVLLIVIVAVVFGAGGYLRQRLLRKNKR